MYMNPRKTRAEMKVETRDRLLDATRDVVARVGFAQATVEQISEHAGYTRGAFYGNFTDKADAFMSLLERDRAAQMASLRKVIEDAPDDEKLAGMQAWFDGGSDDGLDLAYWEFWPVAVRDPELRERMAARDRATQDLVAELMAPFATEAGLLAVSLDDLALMMVAIGDGLGVRRMIRPEAAGDGMFATMAAYLWFGVIATGGDEELFSR